MAFFYGVSLFSSGLLIPFFPLVLSERGLDAQSIGYLLAAPYLLRLFTLPFIGFITDRLPDRRIALVTLATLAAAFGMMLRFSDTRTGLFVLAALLIVASQSMTPVTDSIALSLERRGLGNYGRMRLWGSATFILASMAGGALLGTFGAGTVYDMMLVSMAITALAVFLLQPNKSRNPAAAPPALGPSVLRSRPFLAVLLAGGLIQASHAALYGFGTLAWRQRGYSDFLIGNLWAIGVIAEIMLFAAAPFVLRRFAARQLLLFSAFVGLVRWLIFPIDAGPMFATLIQIMHAGSFASAHIGMMRYISDVVPDEKTTAAQGSYMVLIGLAMAASTALSGPLFKAYGIHSFMAMSVFSLMAIALLMMRRLIPQHQSGVVGA